MGRFEKEWTKSKLDAATINIGSYEFRLLWLAYNVRNAGIENHAVIAMMAQAFIVQDSFVVSLAGEQ